MNIEEQIKHIEYLRAAEIEAWKRWSESETAEHGAAAALEYATAQLDTALANFVAPVMGSDTLETLACRIKRKG